MEDQSMTDVPLPPMEDRGALILGLTGTSFGLATIAVLLRLRVKWRLHGHGLDDYSIYIAWLLSICSLDVAAHAVPAGLGRHVVYLSLPSLAEMLKWATIGQISVSLGVGFVRLSVCILILRLIKGTRQRMIPFLLWAVIVSNAIFTIITVFLVGFKCVPFEKNWNPELDGHCFNPQILTEVTRALGAVGCIMDFACVAAALLVLRGLKLSRTKKAGIMVVMSLGVLTAACSIGKAVTTEFVSEDYSWENTPVFIWAGEEHYLGVLVACLPTLRPLYSDIGEAASSTWRLVSFRSQSTRVDEITSVRSRSTGSAPSQKPSIANIELTHQTV